jgi:hypothetical protein
VIGGTSAGYWVQLHSTGEVTVKALNPGETVATTGWPTAAFDASVFHTLEVAFQGDALQVALDGRRLTFTQNGNVVTTVSIPASQAPGATNQGAAGVLFACENHRGQIGGQYARNLVVSSYQPLAAAAPNDNPVVVPVPGDGLGPAKEVK